MSFLSAYRRGIVLFTKLCFAIYIRKFEIVGKENVPREGPLILVSNHLNNADPPAIIAGVPRNPMFMAKREMIGWPILGPAFRVFGAFPVRRGTADLAALHAAGEVVERGDMLVMFPEGTRSRTGGLKKPHSGTAVVALQTGAPIVPVAITGTGSISWPWLFIMPMAIKHVKMVIGEPFHLPPVERVDADAAAASMDIIMRRIAALLPEAYRGVYADVESTTPAT